MVRGWGARRTVLLSAALLACGAGMPAQASAAPVVSRQPVGFAKDVTGGAGGHIVTVKNAVDLERELCHSVQGNTCTDNEARIIQVQGTIDLTTTEQQGSALGCYATQTCTGSVKSEVTLMLTPSEEYRCNNRDGRRNYTYWKAGVNGMIVGSNKTVIGVGNDARVKGKGFLLQNVSNVIVRNLAITDINEGLVFGGDGITVKNSSRVWIDHNVFARIGRQMISVGDETFEVGADHLAISNNEFDGRSAYAARCDGHHYWGILLYGWGNMTLAGNWLHDFSGRSPQVQAGTRALNLQIVNNLFEDGDWFALREEGPPTAHVLLEGNYFDNVLQPVYNKAPAGGAQLYGVYDQTAAAQASCTAALGRQCRGNIAAPMPTADNQRMPQDSAVLNAMKPLASQLVKPYAAKDVPATVKANAGPGHI
jgi:pectin lyase